MVYQSYNFGSKFKELRRSKGISIEKVAKDITSKSHLSNWKNGKATLDITVFVKLLSKINIQPAEFFKDYEVYELHAYTDDIVEMYANNDTNGIKGLINLLESDYKLNPKNKVTFFKLAIAANFYMDLSGKKLFSDKNSSILWMYFSEPKKWYAKDVILFANTQLLLSSEQVYHAARVLISYSS